MLILDEAVSALDKSVEAQVLNLLRYLKRQFNLTYVFISHDLNVVQYISDRVLVMYLGQVVEIGPVDAIYAHAKHPYTKALFSSRLSMDPDDRVDEAPLTGDPPNPINPPSGCRFRTRCPFAEDVCAAKMPAIGAWVDRSSHLAACHMEDAVLGAQPRWPGARQHDAGSARRGRGQCLIRRRAMALQLTTSGAELKAPAAVPTRPLVEVKDLTVKFVSREATVQAVNGVSFEMAPGEVLCIIGESGSGKSVTMRALMRLLPQAPRRAGREHARRRL